MMRGLRRLPLLMRRLRLLLPRLTLLSNLPLLPRLTLRPLRCVALLTRPRPSRHLPSLSLLLPAVPLRGPVSLHHPWRCLLNRPRSCPLPSLTLLLPALPVRPLPRLLPRLLPAVPLRPLRGLALLSQTLSQRHLRGVAFLLGRLRLLPTLPLRRSTLLHRPLLVGRLPLRRLPLLMRRLCLLRSLPQRHRPLLSLRSLALPGFALPRLVLPGLALPRLALPGLVLPRLVLSHLALPGLALPGLALPGLALSRLVLPGLVRRGLPLGALALRRCRGLGLAAVVGLVLGWGPLVHQSRYLSVGGVARPPAWASHFCQLFVQPPLLIDFSSTALTNFTMSSFCFGMPMP
jgi:hypothetical protein